MRYSLSAKEVRLGVSRRRWEGDVRFSLLKLRGHFPTSQPLEGHVRDKCEELRARAQSVHRHEVNYDKSSCLKEFQCIVLTVSYINNILPYHEHIQFPKFLQASQPSFQTPHLSLSEHNSPGYHIISYKASLPPLRRPKCIPFPGSHLQAPVSSDADAYPFQTQP